MSGFYVDIYNASGVQQNSNTYQISDVRLTQRVNRVGEITFRMPAVVARDMALAKGMQYKVYHEVQGLIGTFYHDDMTVDADNQTAEITAQDLLVKLANTCLLFNLEYNDLSVVDILYDVIGRSIWPGNLLFVSGTTWGNLTIEFQGESIMTAVSEICSYLRGYFTLVGSDIKFGRYQDLGSTWSQYGGFTYGSGTYKGELGTIPANTAAWLLNPAVLSSLTDAPTEYAIITRLQRQSKGGAVVTRVYPVGSGLGQTQLDLSYSTRTTPYTIAYDSYYGSTGVYIEDTAATAAYGMIQRVLPFSIRPLTNSEADLTNAANALYDVAVAYLQRFKAPQEIYSVSCINLPATVVPGDIVVINFYGVAELEDGAHSFLSLENAPFYVTEITRTYGESGNPTYDLVISTSGEAEATTIDVFTNILEDLGKFKVRPQPSQTYYTKASPTLPIDTTRYIDFTFRMGAEVLLLNDMRVEFRVMPLRSSTSNVASGGGGYVTSTSGGGSTPTSTSGGGTTQTSTSGGGTTVTSSSGGGTTVSSANANTPHSHYVLIYSGSSSDLVYLSGGTLLSTGASYNPNSIATSTDNAAHTHGVTVPNHDHTSTLYPHTHDVTVPNHTHDVTVPNHTHDVDVADHTHSLSFGVIDDTVVPSTLTVWVNGVQATSIRNAETGVIVGNSVSAAGLYDVSILTLLTATDFRNRSHTIRFQCTSGQGQVFAQVLGRVTIQPIAV